MSGEALRRVHLVVLLLLAVGAIRAMAGPGENACRTGLQHSCIYSASILPCLWHFISTHAHVNTPGIHAAEHSRSETAQVCQLVILSHSLRCCHT